MAVDKQTLDKVVKYVNESPKYTFKGLLTEYNLLSGYTERGSDFLVRCPFHLDDSPSCSFNDTKHGFHCFSCGRSGNYVNFLASYKNEKLGKNTNFYSEAEQLLKDDPEMQAALDIHTVYRQEDSFNPNRIRPHLKMVKHQDEDVYMPQTYLGLSNLMLERKCSYQDVKKMIMLMQQDLSVSDIYDEIFGSKSKPACTAFYDLDKILSVE